MSVAMLLRRASGGTSWLPRVVLLGALLLGVGLWGVLRPAEALAHPLAPIALTIEQRGDEVYASVKRARVQKRGARLAPRFPGGCHALGPVRVEEHDAYVLERYRLRCDGPLVGAAFGVDGLSQAGVDAVVRVTLADGREVRGLLDRSEDELRVPACPAATAMLRTYLRAGLLHLLGGLDHVLFVLGLTLLLRRRRRVLLALTAFTAGHGLSMCAAALGWVALPARLAEVAIAATLVWLGHRLVRPPARVASLPRPYAASLGVGLIHGLGFAAAFEQAELSGVQLLKALGCFHLGIELGQLLVVLAALLLLQTIVPALERRGAARSSGAERRPSTARPLSARMAVATGYLIGSLSCMWLIERALAMVG